MAHFQVKKYTPDKKQEWDDFIKKSKNGSFLFQRDFMDYHQDRFIDFSLMIYRDKKLIGLLPANQKGAEVYAHQGLTYGDWVLSRKTKFEKTLEGFKALLQFLTKSGVKALYIKPVPAIYHNYPSGEISYLLSLLKADLVKREFSGAVYMPDRVKMQYSRRRGFKIAQKHQLKIEKEQQFKNFWEEILIPNLKLRHDATPVHSLVEIEHLAQKFPQHIHQYNVYKDEKIIGGTTIFETDRVAHTQYIAAGKNRQTYRTLDFLFHELITKEFKHKTYFDFGTSNENHRLNRGLLYWKESFGARGVNYDTYRLNPENYKYLNDVFV